MLTLTYGVLPSKDEFLARFEKECETGVYRIRNCHRVGDVDFTAEELWKELGKAVQEWQECEETAETIDAWRDNGDWACCVLTTLGIEWV